jgi:monovalent cation/hydrogen antiporter
MKLKAESLTNDGTALVLYAIALSLALGGQITPWSVTLTVLVSYVGGAAAGIVVAAAAYLLLRRLSGTLAINLTLLLVPFTAFLIAELIDASGVLAVVFAGIIVAWVSPRVTTASSRRQADAAWPLGVYLLNGALFVLIGLEVQHVVHEISPAQIGWLSLVTAAGAPLDGRDAVVFVTAGVIVLSLLVQGPLLVGVVRWARLPQDDADLDEIEIAQRAISAAALAALDDLALEHGISDDVRGRARRDGYEHLELANARALERQRQTLLNREIAELEIVIATTDDDAVRADTSTTSFVAPSGAAAAAPLEMLASSTDVDVAQRSPIVRFDEASRLRLALLGRKREVLLRLRREGTIDDLVARRLQSGLDLEELRLDGARAPR